MLKRVEQKILCILFTLVVFSFCFSPVVHAEPDGTQTIYTIVPANVILVVSDKGNVIIDGTDYTGGKYSVLYDLSSPIIVKPFEGYDLLRVLLNGTDITEKVNRDGVLQINIQDNCELKISFGKMQDSGTHDDIRADNNTLNSGVIRLAVPKTSDNNTMSWSLLFVVSLLLAITCIHWLY